MDLCARFDWQYDFRTSKRSISGTKKNHGSRASFRVGLASTKRFSNLKKIKPRKRRAIPECLRGSSRLCNRFTLSAAYYIGLPHHRAKRVSYTLRTAGRDGREGDRLGFGTCLPAIPTYMILYCDIPHTYLPVCYSTVSVIFPVTPSTIIIIRAVL